MTYAIEENEQGFNLTVKEQSILLPLEYMEGEDGLMNGKPFDGVYGVVNGGPGYVFYSDGTIEVVTTHEAEVTKDSISFGGLTYTINAITPQEVRCLSTLRRFTWKCRCCGW